MDQVLIKKYAEEFECVLLRHAVKDQEAARFHRAVLGLICNVRSGQITLPLEPRAIPGKLIFNAGHLREYLDLDLAFAKFSLEITGLK